MFLRNLVTILLILVFSTSFSADLMREKRIASQIEEAILDGDVEFLKDGEHDFLSIYMRSELEKSKGGIILMHGLGANPDWVDVIQPLRTGLPEFGWDTLSIQLPVAREGATDEEWSATVDEAKPRVDAAIAFLKQQNILNVVIVAHSFGSEMAANYLAGTKATAVQGFASIGMSANPRERNSGNLGALRTIKMPIIDLYGSQDLDAVLRSAQERKFAAIDAGNLSYRQIEVEGADHFFTGQDEQLVAIVRGWLHKEMVGTELKIK